MDDWVKVESHLQPDGKRAELLFNRNPLRGDWSWCVQYRGNGTYFPTKEAALIYTILCRMKWRYIKCSRGDLIDYYLRHLHEVDEMAVR